MLIVEAFDILKKAARRSMRQAVVIRRNFRTVEDSLRCALPSLDREF